MPQETAWDFPGNSAGQIRGIADAGIETFNGDVLRALARETCQNSLDAARVSSTVRIDFVRDTVQTSEVPGLAELQDAFASGFNYWKDQSERAAAFLASASGTLKSTTTSVLRISDFGTKGLSEPFRRGLAGSWSYLTKVDGAASKGSGTGGSFGIGKNAPFSASAVRTVFYRTLNENGERAAQGVARLLSFPGPRAHITSGFGYYGDTSWNGPVPRIEALDTLYDRRDTGTDLFIYGFQGGRDWLNKMEAEILDNFLVALYEGKLEVRLEDRAAPGEEPVILNAKTIGERLLGEVAGASALTRGFYEVLSGDEETTKTFTKDIMGLGTARLRVAMDPKYASNRRVMVVRGRGMKLFLQARFPSYLNFAAVLDLQGNALNDYFREMESASHDSWDPMRHHDPKGARKQWDALRTWMRATIRSLGGTASDGEIEAAGQTQFLRGSAEDEQRASQSGQKSWLPDPAQLLSIEPIGKKKKRQPGEVLRKSPGQDEAQDTSDETTRIETRRAGHAGDPAPSIRPRVPSRTPGTQGKKQWRVAGTLESQRVIRLGDGIFRIALTVNEPVDKGTVELTYVGENAHSVAVDVAAFQTSEPGITFDRQSRRITLEGIEAGRRIQFDVRVRESDNYAMRANIYADR